MSDALVARALLDRDPPVDLPDGTTYLIRWIHKHAHEDGPVLAFARRDAVTEVAKAAHAPESWVTVADVSPDELVAAWERWNAMEPPPLTNCHALVAYVPPLDADGFPTGPHTATCGCRLFGRALVGPCPEHGRLITPVGPGEFSIGPFTAPRGTPCPR